MTPPKFTRVARTLRKKDTWAEKLLWSWLRDRRFSSYRFHRQHPIAPHILDFFCREAWVDIELDGFQHGTREQQAKDVNAMRFWKRVASRCSDSGLPTAVRERCHPRHDLADVAGARSASTAGLLPANAA
jgi:hypothetical protein